MLANYLLLIFGCLFFVGRFAAAINDQQMDSWVMNVVPVSGPNTLPVIYDRGLIGVMHDWYLLIFSYHLSVHFLFSILPANSLKLLLCMCTHACIYVYIRMYLFQKFLAPGPLLY